MSNVEEFGCPTWCTTDQHEFGTDDHSGDVAVFNDYLGGKIMAWAHEWVDLDDGCVVRIGILDAASRAMEAALGLDQAEAFARAVFGRVAALRRVSA